jgi:hypothetical protein
VLNSWHILPDTPLRRGLDSDALMRVGCDTLRNAAGYLHQLPYGRNSDRSNYKLVVPESRGTCSTKHALLAAVAAAQGIPVSLTIGIYDMTEANTPGVGPVLAAHGLHSFPEAHCYLTYQGDRVDITRAGVTAATAISHFAREWSILPSQIGAHKVRLHQDYLARWRLAQRPLRLTLDELWKIREACIAALSG